MPVYDFECTKCANIEEHIADYDRYTWFCSKCGADMVRIISVSGPNCANEDAEWIRSVREVVDKEGGPASQRFLKNPTRANYKKWMKAEGLRPFEPGEKPKRPEEWKPDIDKLVRMKREREK